MARILILILFLVDGMASLLAQPTFINGRYASGLHIVQLDKTHLRGYYESYTGMDEATGNPMFSCVFFIEGTYKGTDKYTLKTYYPFGTDTIYGELMVADSNMLHIWLEKDPGGCWNVQPFASGMVTFNLEKKAPTINLAYVKSDKAYFHRSPDAKTRRKGYVLKGQVVQVERIKGTFAYCVYEGEVTTKGWIQLEELKF